MSVRSMFMPCCFGRHRKGKDLNSISHCTNVSQCDLVGIDMYYPKSEHAYDNHASIFEKVSVGSLVEVLDHQHSLCGQNNNNNCVLPKLLTFHKKSFKIQPERREDTKKQKLKNASITEFRKVETIEFGHDPDNLEDNLDFLNGDSDNFERRECKKYIEVEESKPEKLACTCFKFYFGFGHSCSPYQGDNDGDKRKKLKLRNRNKQMRKLLKDIERHDCILEMCAEKLNPGLSLNFKTDNLVEKTSLPESNNESPVKGSNCDDLDNISVTLDTYDSNLVNDHTDLTHLSVDCQQEEVICQKSSLIEEIELLLSNYHSQLSVDEMQYCDGDKSLLDIYLDNILACHINEESLTSPEFFDIQGSVDSNVSLRQHKSSPKPERPKSEVGVRWADEDDTFAADRANSPVRMRPKTHPKSELPRPKSDIEGSSFLSDRMKMFGSEISLQPYRSLKNLYEIKRCDLDKLKNRRMSTPHPIKSRLQRAPRKLHKQPQLVRSSSMPESLDKIHKHKKMHHLLDFQTDNLSGHVDMEECFSDDSNLSFDHASLQERSFSRQSSTSHLTGMEEEEDNLTYAEALWDHITMDPEELGFRAQDVIEVVDMVDKDWWFGVIEERKGWFPAAFVRLLVNQDQLEDDFDLDLVQPTLTATSPKLRRVSIFNKNQARSNVVNEIISAERDYVTHLKDVVEGYIQHARKRKEMFSEERIQIIFGNIEKIYTFAQDFVSQLNKCIDVCPHMSEIGQCFLNNVGGFEIYSDYCNNHPSACEELKELCKNTKFQHFFEACRLLQELVEIPLEGFLLTPVQKICKYPLQLAELLKYTPPDHADYNKVRDALMAMRNIATLINERKRKMESIEKIAAWQNSVVDWEGEDLLARSSELIFSGEVNKINSAGWSQDRYFFLFDHQLIYCKKELLKRHVFSYKGCIDLDHCEIIDIPDGKDHQYNVNVKNAWKFHETLKNKWYLVYGKSSAVKQRWLKALKDERHKVQEDKENEKHSSSRSPQSQHALPKDMKTFTYSTIPRHRHTATNADKKKPWFKFGGKKSK